LETVIASSDPDLDTDADDTGHIRGVTLVTAMTQGDEEL
jgi:hypothetical protein